MLPERAVLQNAKGSFVYVVNSEQRAEVRQLRLGLEVDGGRIVEAGLNAGEQVVVEGLVRVRPGALLASEVIEISHNYGPKPQFVDSDRLHVSKLDGARGEVVQ